MSFRLPEKSPNLQNCNAAVSCFDIIKHTIKINSRIQKIPVLLIICTSYNKRLVNVDGGPSAIFKISIFCQQHCLHCKNTRFSADLKHRSACLHFGSSVQWTANDFWNKASATLVIKWNGQTATTPIFQQQQHTWVGIRHTARTHTTHNNNTQGIRLFYYFATRLMAQDHAITSLCTGHLLGARRETTPWFIGQPWLIK